jgi:ankyrin repeat protein
MQHDLQSFLGEIKDLPQFVALGDKFTGVSTRGLFDDTPLHVAAVRGDVHIIGLLLDAGAEIDVRGEHGHTPLHEAAGQGHIEAVKLLVSRGANPNIPNDWGQTARDSARIGGKHEIEILFDDAA